MSLIVLNFISTSVLFFCLLFYKYIFPKKNINHLSLIILISLLPIISILRPGTYESGDFNIHIFREIDFYKSLSEGNLLPSWAGNLNATFGYPLFIFNYSLPYYFMSIFKFFNFGFILSEKIVLILTFVLSGVFMYLFSKKVFKNDLAAFTAGVFYLFAPYHLIDLHFKVAIGELFIFTLLPLIFYFGHNVFFEKKLSSFILLSLTSSALIMSHAILAFFCFALLCAYILYLAIKEKELKPVLLNLTAIFFGILGASYTLFSPLILQQYSYTSVVAARWGYFPNIIDLLYSPWKFGLLFQGPNGEISFIFGYTQILVFIFGVFYLLRKTKNKERINLLFWIISFIVILFLITSYSKPFWELIPYMKSAGSHRLILLLTFSASIIAGYISIFLKKRQILIYILIIFTIGYTGLNWGHRRLIPQINDNVLKQEQSLSTYQGEAHYYANSKWININNPWFSKVPKNHLEIVSGKADIKETFRNSTKHVYQVNAYTNLQLRENTLYYPGWTARSNNHNILLKPDANGKIILKLKSGKQQLVFEYRDLKSITFLKLMSSMTILILFLAYLNKII